MPADSVLPPVEGLLVRVADRPLSTNLTAAAAAADELLEVEWAGRFPAGPGTVQLNGTNYPYQLADEDAATVLLEAPGLLAAADEGDEVTLVNGDQLMADREAWVALPTSDEPIIVNVSIGLRDRVLPGESETAGDLYADPWPCLVDGRLLELVDVTGRAPDVDGGYLVTATVSANALTTSAAGDDVVNYAFEDWQPLGETAKFDAWRRSWFFGTDGDAYIAATDPGDQIAGSVSAIVRTLNDTAGLRHITDRVYPVHGGQVIQVSASIRGSRVVDRSATATPNLVELVVHTAVEGHDPEEIFAAPDAVWQSAVVMDHVGLAAETVTGTVTVPDGHTRMRISVGALPAGDGAGYDLIHDEVHKATVGDTGAQHVEELSVGTVAAPSADAILIGGQTLTEFLAANYQPVATPPTYLTFPATELRSYDSTGTLLPPSDDYCRLGYNAETGNRKAAAWFDEAAIAAALAGVTVDAVEVYLFCLARGGTGAGVVPVGFHGDATPRSTYAAITGKLENQHRPGGFNANSGQWVPLTTSPTSWAAGTFKGLVFGPGQTAGGVLSSSLAYSNRLAGLTTPDRNVALRFTVH